MKFFDFFFLRKVRRINLDRITDENGLLSYGLLARWAILYSSAFSPEEESLCNDWKALSRSFAVEITYVDDEEDSICFSSDEDLIDALSQYSKLKQQSTSNSSVILRCKAIVEERKLKSKEKKIVDAVPNQRNSFETGDKDSRNRDNTCSKASAYRLYPVNLAGYDRHFVHARHTCDGCGTAPIIGLRYHAQDIPDFDYCETCMANYHGTEVIFQPEQLGMY